MGQRLLLGIDGFFFFFFGKLNSVSIKPLG